MEDEDRLSLLQMNQDQLEDVARVCNLIPSFTMKILNSPKTV